MREQPVYERFDVTEAYKCMRAGMSLQEIATKHGTSTHSIRKLLSQYRKDYPSLPTFQRNTHLKQQEVIPEEGTAEWALWMANGDGIRITEKMDAAKWRRTKSNPLYRDLPPATLSRLLNEYRMPVSDIADEYHVSTQSVYRLAKQYRMEIPKDLPRIESELTEAKKEEILRYKREFDHTAAQIAKRVGLPVVTVQNYLNKQENKRGYIWKRVYAVPKPRSYYEYIELVEEFQLKTLCMIWGMTFAELDELREQCGVSKTRQRQAMDERRRRDKENRALGDKLFLDSLSPEWREIEMMVREHHERYKEKYGREYNPNGYIHRRMMKINEQRLAKLKPQIQAMRSSQTNRESEFRQQLIDGFSRIEQSMDAWGKFNPMDSNGHPESQG